MSKISEDVRMIGFGCKKKRKIKLLRGWVEELRTAVFGMGTEIDSLKRNINCDRVDLLHRLEESEKYRLRAVNLINSLRAKFEIDELDQYLQQIIKDSDPANFSPIVHFFSASITKIRNALSFAEAKASDCAFGSVDPLKQTLSAPS